MIDVLEFLRNRAATGYEENYIETLKNLLIEMANKISFSAKISFILKTDIQDNLYLFITNPDRWADKRDENIPCIAYYAHTDSPNLIVRGITDDGFLKIAETGSVDYYILPGTPVKIQGINDCYNGVISVRSWHKSTYEELDKPLKMKDLFIDIGATKKDEVEKLIEIGSPVFIGDSRGTLLNDNIYSPELDDKIGVFVLLKSFEILISENIQKLIDIVNDKDICFLFTSQEENGELSSGASITYDKVKPTIALAVDVDINNDYEYMKDYPMPDCKLGGGVSIGIGPVLDKTVSKYLKKVCVENEIKHQITLNNKAAGIDVEIVRNIGSGCRIGYIGIPSRYAHSAIEVVNMKDVDDTIKLVVNSVLSAKEIV